MLALLLGSGVRRSGLLRLTMEHIQQREGKITGSSSTSSAKAVTCAPSLSRRGSRQGSIFGHPHPASSGKGFRAAPRDALVPIPCSRPSGVSSKRGLRTWCPAVRGRQSTASSTGWLMALAALFACGSILHLCRALLAGCGSPAFPLKEPVAPVHPEHGQSSPHRINSAVDQGSGPPGCKRLVKLVGKGIGP